MATPSDTPEQSRPLNPKQRSFVIEYLKDKNATQAAIRAGYSAKTAQQISSELLLKPVISKAISDVIGSQAEKAEIDGIIVLRELYRILTVDIAGAFEENGALKPIQDIPEDIRRAISSVEVDEIWEQEGNRKVEVGETKKVKFWSKTEAAQLLGKNLKLWADKAGVNIFINGDVEMVLDIKT